MKILFLGDIVGREARKTVLSGLPKLKNKYEADIIIINIENANQINLAFEDMLSNTNKLFNERYKISLNVLKIIERLKKK